MKRLIFSRGHILVAYNEQDLALLGYLKIVQPGTKAKLVIKSSS